ncbi:hypothetical protein FRB95_002587 [Tulasnella sp. JGI-2019a]|nr:hypothetical protein FRB95_002587 [Tulasnella sp. JGI-2019a]
MQIDPQNLSDHPVAVSEPGAADHPNRNLAMRNSQSTSSDGRGSASAGFPNGMPGEAVPCTSRSGSSALEIEGYLVFEQRYYIGVYADVWRGRWVPPGGHEISVAIKCLRCVEMSNQSSQTPEAQAARLDVRLRREVTAWEKHSHPNIAPLLGYRSGDKSLLITHFYKNGNLGTYLLANPDAPRLKLIVGVANGLLYLHSLNPAVVHGDIKPDNMLVNDAGEAAFCDFGLARIQEPRTGLTTSAHGQGGKGYLAPELLDGEGKTKASDVFAFGGLILHAVSGLGPFHNVSSHKASLAVSTGRVPSKDQHPVINPRATIWDLMMRCWTKDPAGRPDMREVYSMLLEEERSYATTGSLRLNH